MLSIIIPVLNEAETIKKLLHHLSENSSGDNEIEIIVVDGGSSDETKGVIKNFIVASSRPVGFQKTDRSFNIQVVNSNKGRAKQMNTGAKLVSNRDGQADEILYFLHADSFPPKNFDNYIISEVNKGNPAGCFQMKFDSAHWWLQLAGWLTKFKWQGCRGGDQSQFISKKLFDEIGGFDENYIIYEDNILISELYKRESFVVIPQWLTTSARRYRELGVWRLQYHFWAIHLKKWLGANAQELHQYYQKNISQVSNKSIYQK